MLFQRINRTDPEKVFVIVKNSYSTASLSNGQAVVWDYVTDADGIGVTIPPANATASVNAIAFAGIITQTIAPGEYGLCQVYGHHSAIRVRRETNRAISAGEGLIMAPEGSVFCLSAPFTTGAEAGQGIVAIAGAAYTLWTTTTIAGFIKAM